MTENVYCYICGVDFKAHHHNQRYCSDECRREAYRISNRKWKKNYTKKRKAVAPKHNHPSIEQMVDVAMKLSKKLGRRMGYGDVQRMLITGKLEVKDGVIAYGE